MLKPLFALLFVLAALSGGIYALHESKGPKRSKTEDASLLLRRYQHYFSAASSAPAATIPDTLGIPPRVVAVVLAALVFGSAAYLGLGQTLEADAVPTTPAAVVFNNTSLHDELRPAAWHSESELAKLMVSAQLAPPAAPAADVAVAAAPPAEVPAPEPPPEPEPEPVVEAAVPVFVPPEGGLEAIVCAMPWPCDEAIAVASCESGLDSNGRLDGNWATNGSDYGLFQIRYIHAWRWADFYDAWMDPNRNTQWAFEIWSESGWRPWACRPY
jgi:hypothetical protein